jgi:hypothetical protein
MKFCVALGAAVLVMVAVPANAQGVPGGVAHGTYEGSRIAGPVGAVVGGAVGGVVGGVEGVFGINHAYVGYAQPAPPPRYYRHRHVVRKKVRRSRHAYR